MPEQYSHLDLPLYPQSYGRQFRRGRSSYTPRSTAAKVDYLSIQTEQIGNLQRVLEADKAKFDEFIDPNLIFKLEIIQRVNEDTLRTELRRMDIDVLAPSPDKSGGLWVVFAADKEVKKFQEKLRSYVEEDRYSFFNAIGRIVDIPPEEKIGSRLAEQPLATEESTYLDLEIWRMEDERLNKFIDELTSLILAKGDRVTDRLITNNFCLLRVRLNMDTLNTILSLREIASVDRPPRPYIDLSLLKTDLETIAVGATPPNNATAIAVLDSGILSGHPLLSNAVGDEIAMGTRNSEKIRDGKPEDDVGHGTKVAGIALYGDVRTCCERREFKSEIWILSAKVMYAEENPITGQMEAKYDEEELLEHQLQRVIEYFANNYSNCRVVNLSLGDEDKRMFGQRKQFNLAALVDELAGKHKLLFVISAGNLMECEQHGFPETYPNYLLADTDTAKIIDPATAALALTVGAVTPPYGPLNRYPDDFFYSPATTRYPSPFTRVGPGYQGMIKPELVEEGGNIIRDRRGVVPDLGGKIVTLNPRWLDEGRMFTVDQGTSLSAPKVTHLAARLFNQYPNASPNLIKALLLSSAQIPDDRPLPLSDIDLEAADGRLIDLLKVYGYGQPDFDRACFSTDRSVVLLREKQIKLNGVDVYYFYLPPEFIEVPGRKRLMVTLVYDPPTNKNRLDYLGCTLDFRLFKNMEVDEVVQAYGAIRAEEIEDDETPENLRTQEISLHPKSNLRKRGVHQRGIKEYRRQPQFDPDRPLVLAVVCQNRWIRDEHHLQDYALAVTLEHQTEIDLFNRVRARIQERARVSVR